MSNFSIILYLTLKKFALRAFQTKNETNKSVKEYKFVYFNQDNSIDMNCV